MKQIIKVLAVFVIICSCGDRTKRNDTHANKEMPFNKEGQKEKYCSLDADSLDGEKVLRVAEKMPYYNGGMANYFYDLILKDIGSSRNHEMGQSN